MPPTIMLNLLALVQKPVGLAPGQRYRLEQWAPHLAARHGIRLHFVPFESPPLTAVLYEKGRYRDKALGMLRDTWRRRLVLSQARSYDGVVIYREAASLGPAIYERLLAALRVPVIFDFDDAIWIPVVGSSNGAFSRLRFQGKTAAICRLAAAVTVGNEYLAGYARRHARNVHVVPTTIELAEYPPPPRLPLVPGAPFVVTWSGSQATVGYLERLRPALEALARRRSVEVRVICNHAVPGFANARTTFVRWRAASEAADLARAHVGVMPLPDDEFTRGKCGLKGLQYMAAGLPAVLSPVGVNRDIVRHGENGLLASTPEEWVRALALLADDEGLRQRLGEAGRRTVAERYAAPLSAARFAQAVLSVCRRHGETRWGRAFASAGQAGINWGTHAD